MLKSLKAKAAILLLVFLVLPLLIYDQFRTADMEKRTLLLESLANEGRVVAELLRPRLHDYDGEALRHITQALQRIRVVDGRNIKLLLHPADPRAEGRFFFIAHAPKVSEDYLAETRAQLIETGVLGELRADCATGDRDGVRSVNISGKTEVLTSITPIRTESGCWAVITSHAGDDAIGAAIGQPYWRMPQVQLASAIYLAMALMVLLLALDVWRNLRRFAAAAESIGARPTADGPSFRALNRIPELDGVARAFDRMVVTLSSTAWVIRRAAEDNAHALKTPLSTIAQSLDPLKSALPAHAVHGHRALTLIERAVFRLDDLVDAARQVDRATADILVAPQADVDLGALLEETLEAQADRAAAQGLTFERDIETGGVVGGSRPLLLPVAENLIANAIDFAPPGSAVRVELHADDEGGAEFSVSDNGPGVPEDSRERIFDRYYSTRAGTGASESRGVVGEAHAGIGLWVARRNVEALGGTIRAEANEPAGLRVVVRLPLRPPDRASTTKTPLPRRGSG